MSMINDILERVGLKFEDLTSEEEKTLQSWLVKLDQKGFNVNNVKEYIVAMRKSIDNEVSETTHGTKQDLYLKARLRNYILLEAFLDTPRKAKEALERSLAGIVHNKN